MNFREFYRNIFKDRVQILKDSTKECESVLDLGCGKDSIIKYCNIKDSLGVDAFEPYILESRENKIHNKYILKNINDVEFNPNSFDAVIALEVLEHLPKGEGMNLLKKMERWAKKKVIISCPNGFVSQDGYDNNSFQKHLSSWTPEEFREKGYEIFGFHGFKKLRGHMSDVKYKPVFIWERISDLTQLFTYRLFCDYSFQFYAIKEHGFKK